MPDFIGALNEAYLQQPAAILGESFSFPAWCDSWLKSSGVNIAAVDYELNEDGTLKALKVKQGCDLRGQNRTRLHKIDIAVFDHEAKLHSIKAVVIQAADETVVDFSAVAGVKVAAIIPNYNDEGYLKSTFDQRSLDFLENNLHKIEDKLVRGAYWRHLWGAVSDLKVSSSQYLKTVVNNFAHEDVF